MALTLPWIVILAAILYLVASKAGWLEALGKRSSGRPLRGGRRQEPDPQDAEEVGAIHRRLEVFEEFLNKLGRDDSEKHS